MARRGRESVLLGSKLCSERDIVNRGNKALSLETCNDLSEGNKHSLNTF